MSSHVVINSLPTRSLQRCICLVVIAGQNSHASKFEQADYDFAVVILCEFVAIFARDPRCWDVWGINEEQSVGTVVARHHCVPIVAFDLHTTESFVRGRQALNPSAPPLHARSHAYVRAF